MSYRKGRRFEYQVRDYLESLGFLVFRCAGSKPCDLIAVHPSRPSPLLVECRASRSSRPVFNPGFLDVVLVEKRGDWRSELLRRLRELGYADRLRSSSSSRSSSSTHRSSTSTDAAK